MISQTKKRILETFGQEPTDLDQLGLCVLSVLNRNLAEHDNRVLGLHWTIRYSQNVSNSHSSPEGKPSNWGGRKNGVPTGYPGLIGRVWVRYQYFSKLFGSDSFAQSLTHTGSGGFGDYGGPWQAIGSKRFRLLGNSTASDFFPPVVCYSWDYKIFLDDWPAVADFVSKQLVWKRLCGDNNPVIEHRLAWTDPDTMKNDLIFMNDAKSNEQVKDVVFKTLSTV